MSGAGSDGSRGCSRGAAEEGRPLESRLAMVGGGEVVGPRDHLEKRLPRRITDAGDVIPVLVGTADEDELLLAHPQDARANLGEHLDGDGAVALVGLAPGQVLGVGIQPDASGLSGS